MGCGDPKSQGEDETSASPHPVPMKPPSRTRWALEVPSPKVGVTLPLLPHCTASPCTCSHTWSTQKRDRSTTLTGRSNYRFIGVKRYTEHCVGQRLCDNTAKYRQSKPRQGVSRRMGRSIGSPKQRRESMPRCAITRRAQPAGKECTAQYALVQMNRTRGLTRPSRARPT